MFRVISIIIGYFLGCFLTGDWVARKKAGKSAFEIGTGNPGMANIMKECGFGPGMAVLAGDLAKTVLACVLCRFLLFPSHGLLAAAWAGVGVCLGHDFPFWHHFEGGKGVSTTCAAIFCIRPLWGLIAMTVGMYAVFFTQYLSIGAVLIPFSFALITWFLYQSPELAALLFFLTALMTCRHFPNLQKIAEGTETKTDVVTLLRGKFGRYTIPCVVTGNIVVLILAIIV